MEVRDEMKLLQANFTQAQVSWKPQSAKGNKAMAVAYIDARDVMTRLDEVLGADRWQTEFYPIGDKSIECRLKVKFGDSWVIKTDVGGTSDQPDAGDKIKAAYSDALKRAAVQLGIGRSIYQLPMQWVDYDEQKRRLASEPKLPLWYIQGHQCPPTSSTPVAKAAEPEKPAVPVAKATPEQLSKIEKLFELTKSDVDKFCATFKVTSFSSLTTEQADKAISILKTKAEKMMSEAGKETANV